MQNISLRKISKYTARGISPRYVDNDGLLVLNQKCIRNQKINIKLARLTDKDKKIGSDKKLQKFDILINSTGVGTLGRVAQLKYDLDATADSHITIFRPANIVDGTNEKINPFYVGYCVRNQEKFIESKGAGATGQTELSKDSILDDVQIWLPKYSTQTRIASVLSAYDDLIENNEKRIKALEEMAQLLYTEWFIKFKFPGHQKTKMIDSNSAYGPIPETWEILPLMEVCARITDGSHFSPKSVKNGKPMASVKDMHDWGVDLNGCRLIAAEDYEALVKSDCEPKVNDVLIAKDGSYLKHVFVVDEKANYVILSSIAILRPNGRFLPNQLAYFLKLPHIKSQMKGYVTGAALPRIVLKDFRKFKILVPPVYLQEKWAALCDVKLALCGKLIKEISGLIETRDLLISQLVTGKRELK